MKKLFGFDIEDEYFDFLFCEQTKGKEIDVENGKVVAVEPKPQPIDYEQLVVSKIRERYTIDQELAILRQRDTKPQEFAEYNTYVESCKTLSKEKLNGE